MPFIHILTTLIISHLITAYFVAGIAFPTGPFTLTQKASGCSSSLTMTFVIHVQPAKARSPAISPLLEASPLPRPVGTSCDFSSRLHTPNKGKLVSFTSTISNSHTTLDPLADSIKDTVTETGSPKGSRINISSSTPLHTRQTPKPESGLRLSIHTSRTSLPVKCQRQSSASSTPFRSPLSRSGSGQSTSLPLPCVPSTPSSIVILHFRLHPEVLRAFPSGLNPSFTKHSIVDPPISATPDGPIFSKSQSKKSDDSPNSPRSSVPIPRRHLRPGPKQLVDLDTAFPRASPKRRPSKVHPPPHAASVIKISSQPNILSTSSVSSRGEADAPSSLAGVARQSPIASQPASPALEYRKVPTPSRRIGSSTVSLPGDLSPISAAFSNTEGSTSATRVDHSSKEISSKRKASVSSLPVVRPRKIVKLKVRL